MTPNDRPEHGRVPWASAEEWSFRLYIAGRTSRSLVALANLKRVCEENLHGRYRIEVVDLLEQPAVAATDQVLALPMVVKKGPGPPSRVVGDLSDVSRVMHGLKIEPQHAG